MIDVLGPEKRRRRTTQEKIAIVQQSFEPGMTVSLVARQHGVAASQLFLWRKQYQEGSLTAVAAGDQVVPFPLYPTAADEEEWGGRLR
ncbi:transposase, partial [Shigella sonnei]|uniref:transposase n=1 Tax=Shigella sonnei TaxID=624 RepID=UPI00080C92A6